MNGMIGWICVAIFINAVISVFILNTLGEILNEMQKRHSDNAENGEETWQ